MRKFFLKEVTELLEITETAQKINPKDRNSLKIQLILI